MTLLRNFDKGNEYLDIVQMRSSTKNYDSNMSGWYKLINGDVSGIVIENSNLYILWKNTKYLIDDSSKVIIEDCALNSKSKKFSFFQSGNLIYSFQYKAENYSLDSSPFEYIDYENYDWGCFLSNIINNKSRRSQIIENISK